MASRLAVDDLQPISRLFRALGDETRLKIVALLAHGELCVCHIQDALALSQPAVSRHLSVLRAAGIVEPHRAGTWVYYRLVRQADAESERQLRALVTAFRAKTGMKKELERLMKVRGPDSCR
ncbi:MAG: metalloregulator ArsR/SmtB family transcription factor [bacterium]